MFSATCIAPVNIAVIKYWGKRDEDLILPINDSLSMTLSTDEMCAKTTAAASQDFKENKMWLNGEEVPFESNPRIARCLKELQRLAGVKSQLRFPIDWKLHIASENNFPTAAGLASSAAGYACLVYTLASLYEIEGEELSSIARLGSGSACRSLYGGFVQWQRGECANGSDSLAVQVCPPTHWPNMHVLILVTNDAKKETSSTKGMKLCTDTSDLINYRANHVVPRRIAAIRKAIEGKDFQTFAEITMKDSNQFHAVALDTFPPCVYMNNVSHSISEFVHKFNEAVGCTKIAYTFDAGPNACLYLLEEDVPAVVAAIQEIFPNDNENSIEYVKGIPVDFLKEKTNIGTNLSYSRNLIKYIIHTKVGDGPRKLTSEVDSLLSSTGLPKQLKC